MQGWGEADAALAELGRLEERLAAIEQRRANALARAEVEAARASRTLAARRMKLAAALERFCQRHKPELARVNGHSRRSRRLLFGQVGFRQSQGIVVRNEAAALRALAHWRAGQQFLRVRTEVDREGLRRFLLAGERRPRGWTLVRQRLSRAGVELQQREIWFYELDPCALKRWG